MSTPAALHNAMQCADFPLHPDSRRLREMSSDKKPKRVFRVNCLAAQLFYRQTLRIVFRTMIQINVPLLRSINRANGKLFCEAAFIR
jgi:hypothetical protein